MFHSGPIGVSLTRLSDGVFLDVNKAFLLLFGYERNEVIGSNPLSLNMWVNARDRARMIDALREGGRAPDFETTFRTKTGGIREVLIAAELVDVAQELYILGHTQDITERKRAEEALGSSEERFRSLFETSSDSILLINQETGQILGANPAACKLYGYSPEEFLALKATDISAEPEKTEAEVSQSAPDIPFRLHRKKDAAPFPVEISASYFTEGDLRLNTAFIRDITERKKAEEQLLIANFGIKSSISAIRFADLDGRITSVNDSFLRLWGYDRADEVVGRHISEFAMAGVKGEGVKALQSGRV